MSLYARRLERGRFIWPSPADGIVAISAAQLAYMLDGIPKPMMADARPVHLGHTVKADGRWRLFAFVATAAISCSSSKRACTCRAHQQADFGARRK